MLDNRLSSFAKFARASRMATGHTGLLICRKKNNIRIQKIILLCIMFTKYFMFAERDGMRCRCSSSIIIYLLFRLFLFFVVLTLFRPN